MKRTILQRENIRKISISIDSVADVWKKEEKEKKKKKQRRLNVLLEHCEYL